jgi:hypothetical protein
MRTLRALRVALAILLGGWALVNLFPLLGTAGMKLYRWPVPPDWPPALEQLAQQIPWWGLGVWAVMIALYLAVAQALIRGRSALGLFVAAFVTEIVRWVPMYRLPAYQETWAGGYLQFRYIAWAVLVTAGLLIAWAERRTLRPA